MAVTVARGVTIQRARLEGRDPEHVGSAQRPDGWGVWGADDAVCSGRGDTDAQHAGQSTIRRLRGGRAPSREARWAFINVPESVEKHAPTTCPGPLPHACRSVLAVAARRLRLCTSPATNRGGRSNRSRSRTPIDGRRERPADPRAPLHGRRERPCGPVCLPLGRCRHLPGWSVALDVATPKTFPPRNRHFSSSRRTSRRSSRSIACRQSSA